MVLPWRRSRGASNSCRNDATRRFIGTQLQSLRRRCAEAPLKPRNGRRNAAHLIIVMGASFSARSLMVADDAAWRNDLDKKQIGNLAYWAIAIAMLLLLLLLQNLWQTASQALPVPYSEFEKALNDGRVADITVTDRAFVGRLKTPEGNKTTRVANRVEPDLATRLATYNVSYTRVVENTLIRDLMSWIVPALVFFGLWLLRT